MKKGQNTFARLSLRAFNVFLCNTVAIGFLINMFDLKLSLGLIFVIALASAVSVAVCAARKHRALLISGYFIATFGIGFMLAGSVAAGIKEIVNRFTQMISYAYNLDIASESEADGTAALLIVVGLAAMLTCMLLAIAYTANKNYYGWISVAVSAVVLALVLNIFPSAAYVIAFFVMMVYLKITVSWERAGSQAIVGHSFLMIVVLLIATLVCVEVWNKDRHEESWESGKIRNKVRDWNATAGTRIGNFVSNKINKGGDELAGMSGGMIGKAGIRSLNKTDLIVYLPANAPQTYIKGYTGNQYQFGGWRTDSMDYYEFYRGESEYWKIMESGFEETMSYVLLNQVFQNREAFPPGDALMPLYKSDITIVIAGASSAYQYHTYSEVNGMMIYNTQGIPGSVAVDGSILENTSSLIETDSGELYHKAAQEYLWNYAMMQFTEVPAMFEEALRPVIEEYYSDYLPKHPAITYQETLQGKIDFVKQYLRENYLYTTHPPKNTEDKDPVMFFIEDSHAGYCQHFASTAIMILRLLGVPSRYAEGYVIHGSDIVKAGKSDNNVDGYGEVWEIWGTPDTSQSTDSVMVKVPDGNAHAWAEIWINDYGWFPIEATVGFETSVREWEINRPTPTEKPSVTPSGTVTPKPTGSAKPTPAPGTKNGETVKPVTKTNIWPLLLACGVILLIFGIPATRSTWIRAGRKRKLLARSTKKATIAAYEDIVKLAERFGITRGANEADREFHARLRKELPKVPDAEPFRVITNIAERAAYAGGKITEIERKTMIIYYRGLRKVYLNGLNPVKRVFCKMFGGV
ncbi:MAG: hypothetical protein J5845_04875 [Lachnospiraceae bacterium]|nr:hypothetical protein [Lachnospiraceae bacterium]